MFRDSIYVFDDFYQDPDEMRISVLRRTDWGYFGNYPGIRTGRINYDTSLMLRNVFEEQIIRRRIEDWNVGNNTCFQLCYSWDTTWIHHDPCQWAAVIYLTPDAPPESGTGFFRHKETGIDRYDGNSKNCFNSNWEENTDLNKWDKMAEVSNVYNRAVIYRGDLYHRSMLPGFGNSLETGRLTQTFFFDERFSWR